MKTNLFTLMFAGILAIILFAGVASASFSIQNDGVFDISNVNIPSQVNQDNGTFQITFDISNTGADQNVNFSASSISGGNPSISFSPSSGTQLTSGSMTSATATVTFSKSFVGTISGKIVADPSTVSPPSNITFSTKIIQTPFCDEGNINLTNSDLTVDIENRGEGEDDDWRPLDTIEIDVELDNKENEDLDDVVFEIGIFKKGSDDNIADEMIWISEDDEKFEVGDIDEDEEKNHVFEFRVDPELDDGDYVIKVKAYPDGEEDSQCLDSSFDSSFDEISISKESDQDKMVVVDTTGISSLEAQCGDQVSFSADVWNIGDDDFPDQIKVGLFNKDLGVSMERVILGDFDAGDNAEADFSFEVPEDAEEGTYRLAMETYYDYDEDDDTYDEISEDAFYVYLDVSGNCISIATAETTSVSASLESEGKPGENLEVRMTVTNTGDNPSEYSVNVAGFASWANSANALPDSFTIAAGSSRDVSITLDVKEDVSGEQTFSMELLSGNNVVLTQPVKVMIESPSFFSSITGNVVSEDNWYLWGIGLINVVLVLAIIFIAVRLIRKKE